MQIPDLQKLIVCRNILSDDTLRLFLQTRRAEETSSAVYDFISTMILQAETLGLQGNLLRSYLIYLLAQGNNTAAKLAETTDGKIGTSLEQAFLDDMTILFDLLSVSPSTLLPTTLLDDYVPTNRCPAEHLQSLHAAIAAAASPSALAAALLDHYRRFGCGDIASHRAFRWDSKAGRLVGIRHFEAISLDDLVGYERQKEMLESNTAAFVAGKPANNVLLVGARGTGKSSSVKSLANTFYSQGLRLVQIAKPQLVDLPKVMETLRQISSKKFIIYLDDLSFEEYEVEYKHLKSAIEGGVEGRPANVLIYATSNRRHLIKETWKDRADGQDELYRNDSINETISLSDRFGIIINFLAPSQEEYLAIIDALLQKSAIVLDTEELRIEALRWEITHSGRSGRIAQQFVNHYLGTRQN